MKALTPRQLEAARRNLRKMDARTDWDYVTGPVRSLILPAYGTIWNPDGSRVPFVEGRV